MKLRLYQDASKLRDPISLGEESFVHGIVEVDENPPGIDVPIERLNQSPQDHNVVLIAGIELPRGPVGDAFVHQTFVSAIVINRDVPAECRQLPCQVDHGLLGAGEALGPEQLWIPLMLGMIAIDDEVHSRGRSFEVLGIAFDELLYGKTAGMIKAHVLNRTGFHASARRSAASRTHAPKLPLGRQARISSLSW